MRGRIRTVIATVSLVLVTHDLAACRETSSPPGDLPPRLRLGALVPLSGDNGPTGRRMLPAYEMAVKEANDAGGVLGHRVEFISGDDGCEPGTAVRAANAMVAKDITVSVGGACSAATVPTLKVFRAAGVPMIIPGSNSTDLLAPRYDSVFLLSGTTLIEADRALKWMRLLGSRRVAIIDDGTSFPQTLATAVAKVVRRPSSPPVLAGDQQMTLSQGAPGYRRIASEVIRRRADMVFFTGYYIEAARLIRDLRAAHYTGKIMLSDAGTDPILFKEIDAAKAEGVYGLTLPLAEFTPRAKEWAEHYRNLTGTAPGPFTMQAFDAVSLALNAVRRAGSLDRVAIRAAIAHTSDGDVELLSGPSRFNPDGTQVDPTFIPLQIRNGAFALARPAGWK